MGKATEWFGKPDSILAYAAAIAFAVFAFIGAPNIMACAHMAGLW